MNLKKSFILQTDSATKSAFMIYIEMNLKLFQPKKTNAGFTILIKMEVGGRKPYLFG